MFVIIRLPLFNLKFQFQDTMHKPLFHCHPILSELGVESGKENDSSAIFPSFLFLQIP